MNQILHEHWYTCKNPRLVRNKYTKELVEVGCGHCSACLSRKMARNVPALVRESSVHKYGMFVTLTYKNKYLPHIYIPTLENSILNDNPENYASFLNLKNLSRDFIGLYKGNIPCCQTSDIQKFIKRLRMSISRDFPGKNIQIRYAFSYDYGSTLFRPHYHGQIWFDSAELFSHIAEYVSRAWSVYNRVTKEYDSIGRIDCQESYDCSKYVSAYMQSIEHLPAIYTYKDFRVRLVHSSSPSLGSLVRSLESPEQVVERGLTKVSLYNPLSFEYEIQPLTGSFVRRYFPTIPSFKQLSRDERRELYHICADAPTERKQRLVYFHRNFNVNSFFHDYITLGFKLNSEQLDRKFDTLHYVYNRLKSQSSLFNKTVMEYDTLIENYYKNRYNESLKFQFNYESRFAHHFNQKEIDSIIDLATETNSRNLTKYLSDTPVVVSPLKVDFQYFKQTDIKYNKQIKRKCNNEYLELHPQFKQFH